MRVLQRTVEQIVDPVRVVPLLHDVEPQMVEEQLVDVLSPFDFQVPEQVMSSSRTSLRDARVASCGTAGGSADDSLLLQADR